jgi:hypothetical protein
MPPLMPLFVALAVLLLCCGLIAASGMTWYERHQALTRWRAELRQSPRTGRRSVEVRSTLPMHIHATGVAEGPLDAVLRGLRRWSSDRGYRAVDQSAHEMTFERGKWWISGFAFGIRYVPTKVAVKQSADGTIRWTFDARSSVQWVGSADREEAEMEVSRLVEALATTSSSPG